MLPDLILLGMMLLGMMLPAMEGMARLRQLSPDPRTQLIPVIVLSGLSPKNENSLRLAGAAAYFEKSMLNLSGEGVPCLMLDKA
jgi:CheY-like chemotaxis protein